jgi:(S)-sulfolactate dehydrogenase
MTEIVISEFMDETVVEQLAMDYEVLYDPRLVDAEDDLRDALGDAAALIVRNRTAVSAELLQHAPRLRVVGRLGVGLDNIDLDACARRGIEVCPARGANDAAVAEYVVTMALILLRNAYYAGAEVRAGEWPRTDCMGREAAGKRLGLVGVGAIARQVAERAQALGMQVSGYDPHLAAEERVWRQIERAGSLRELLGISDVVSLHVPLTGETRHLLNATTIADCKQGGLLINAARGGVVDETALIEALRDGWLGGAALDVFEHEPLDREQGQRFAGIENLVLTPHIAGITRESNRRVSALTADNVRRVLQGMH